MAWYPYSYKTAFDPATRSLAPAGSVGQVYAVGDTDFTTPLVTHDLTGLPVELSVQGEAGYIPSFQVEDQTSVIWKSGEYVLELTTTMPLPGPTGARIVDAVDNGDGTITFQLSDGSTVGPVTVPEGPQGERGPAGYNATGAVEDQQTLADYVAETAGANPFSGELKATFASKNTDALRWFRFKLGTVAAEPVDVLAIGDSTTEGARATSKAGRWIDQVVERLRGKHNVTGGEGYIPAVYTPGVPFAGSTWEYFEGSGDTNLFTDSFTGASGDLSTRAGWTVPATHYTLDGADAVTQTAGGIPAYAGVGTAADRELAINATLGTYDATAQYLLVIPLYDGATGNLVQLEAVVANNRSDWRIVKRIGGVTTTMATYATSPVPVDPSGDVVAASIKVDGLTITATVNGSVLTATLTQAEKDALGAANDTGFRLPGIGSKLHDYTATALVGGSIEVFPSLDANYGLGLRSLRLGPTGNADRAVTTFTGTGFDVIVTEQPSGGAVDVSIDGGAVQTIVTDNAATVSGQATRFDGLTSGSHTIELSCTTGNAILEGVMLYDGDENNGIRLWDGAHVGYNAASFTTDTSWSDSLKTLTVPDLVFIALGLNDYAAQSFTPAQFKASLEAIIAEVRAANPHASIVLHNSWERGDVATPTYPWADFVNAMSEIAGADPSVMVVDLNGQLLGWNHVDPAFRTIWDADKVHLSPAGYNVVADSVAGSIEQR